MKLLTRLFDENYVNAQEELESKFPIKLWVQILSYEPLDHTTILHSHAFLVKKALPAQSNSVEVDRISQMRCNKPWEI